MESTGSAQSSMSGPFFEKCQLCIKRSPILGYYLPFITSSKAFWRLYISFLQWCNNFRLYLYFQSLSLRTFNPFSHFRSPYSMCLVMSNVLVLPTSFSRCLICLQPLCTVFLTDSLCARSVKHCSRDASTMTERSVWGNAKNLSSKLRS